MYENSYLSMVMKSGPSGGRVFHANVLRVMTAGYAPADYIKIIVESKALRSTSSDGVNFIVAWIYMG